MTTLLCAIASALALFLAHGTPDLGALAWLAPAPMLWLAFGRDERAGRLALAAGSAYAVGQLGMLWPYWKAMGPVVLAATLPAAIVFALVVLAARRSSQHLPAGAALFVFPTLWTGWEWLSATLSPHGTFGSWAYSQVRTPVMIQGAALLGLWVVSFLIATVAAGAALSLKRRSATPFTLAVALLTLNVAYGAWRLHAPDGPTLRVAASARDHDDHATPDDVARAQAAEVRRLAASGASIVVFDEKAALLPERRRDTVLAPLAAATRETKALVVSGFDQTGAQRRNAAYTLTAGAAVHTYTKRHHIPGLERDYTTGDGPGLIGDGRAVVICKDLDFQRTLRGDAMSAERAAGQGGLGLMLAPAWDFDADAWLHARMAIMRGVEGGYAIVRAASNGLVTVSDAQGRVRAEGRSGRRAYASVMADVPRGAGATTYVRIGDGFAWMAGLVGVALAAWGSRRGTA